MIDLHYLQRLAKEYPTVPKACAQIVNLQGKLSLPKGTEFFFSDLHGEHEAFIHILKSASGIIRSKIDSTFENSVSPQEREELASLIYEPEGALAKRAGQADFDDWCKIVLFRLIEVCKAVSSKYPRSKVRRKTNRDFEQIIDELLHTDTIENRTDYFGAMIRSILDTGMAKEFICGLCGTIRRLSVDKLHIIGDIFDRGPRADAIMNELMLQEDVDIQWGNHDISWMGAFAGSWALIANVIRLGIQYNTFDVLEDGYGINLRPLSDFAARIYRDDPCTLFRPHILDENIYDPVDIDLAAKMHKAIAIIQFKVEGQLIRRHPEYEMEDRILLDQIDFTSGSISLDGQSHPLRDTLFPTVDPACPLELTPEEEETVRAITASFRHSANLQKHIKFLYTHGSMYKTINGNLLYHGCIPMTEEGDFVQVRFDGRDFHGKSYLNYIDQTVRKAYYAPCGTPEKHNARDFLWYLWCGKNSPLFGKNKMTAFERYFLEEKALHQETMTPYYKLIERQEICEKILEEFGLDPETAHIINGHVPVKIKEGESPVKGNGRLFIIDGGISKAYHAKTGIAGYTLIYNSHFLALAEHKPYDAESGKTSPTLRIVELLSNRATLAQTDAGAKLREEIAELSALTEAYRQGTIKEKSD